MQKEDINIKAAGKAKHKYLFFYSHTDETATKISGKSKYKYLSNLCPTPFSTEDPNTGKKIHFACAEQYFFWSKAKLFEDEEIARRILKAISVKNMPEEKDWNKAVSKIFNLHKVIEGVDEEVWAKKRLKIMYKGLTLKFDQNEEAKQALLSTSDKVLAFSGKNKVWSIGCFAQDRNGKISKNALDENKWRGENLLGHALMKVREKLASKNEDA